MKQSLLRSLLLLDAVVLFWLGASLILIPSRAEAIFGFHDLPRAVGYMLGLWGSVFVTLALGYAIAARDPIRHVAWVQVGIARGSLECIVGAVYLAQGIVTFQQSAFGIVIAAAITLAYIVLYPSQSQSAASAA